MAFSFFEYLHSFQRYSSFCSRIATNRSSTKINNKIKNILGKIGVMLLKLGTSKQLKMFEEKTGYSSDVRQFIIVCYHTAQKE